jgi:hypothetical protein
MIASAAAEPLHSTATAALSAAPPGSASRAAAAGALSAADAVLGTAESAGALSGAPLGSSRAGATAKTKKSSAGYAKSTSAASKTKSGSKATGPLAFLKDAKLSIEEKLMRLLSYLNDRWEKDMQKKMEEMAGGQGPSAPKAPATKSTSTKKKGLLGTIGVVADVAKKFFPQAGIAVEALKNPLVRDVVSKIGGPVLAAGASALGFPALAPALLKYGPAVIDVAAGVASAFVDQEGGSGASTAQARSAATSSGSASGGAMSDRQLQVKAMEIQRIMDQQKEMFALVSNILRSGHEARMAVIQNVR